MRIARFLCLSFFSALACLSMPGSVLTAMAETAVPELRARVTDLTGTLSATEQATIEQRLAQFEQEKGSQIAVLLVPSTDEETIEQYSLRVAEKWQLGRAKIDDGALLVIAKNDHKMRIEVGYGLEGALPDAYAKRIIADFITPKFKAGDYYGGISEGVARMISVIQGEALPAPTHKRKSDGDPTFAFLLIGAFIVGRALRAMMGKLPGAAVTGVAASVVIWLILSSLGLAVVLGIVAFIVTLIDGGRGGGGGFYSGGGFGGGGFGGGGGFSGGGGGFGGGGASGGW